MEAAALSTGCELREILAGKCVEHIERLGVKFRSPLEQKIDAD
jgi:hypothetical protein